MPCRIELQLVFEPMGAPIPDAEDRALGMAVVDRMLHSRQRVVRESGASALAATDLGLPDDTTAQRVSGERVGARVSRFQRGRSAAFIAAGIVLGCSMTAAALVPGFSTGIVRAVSSVVGLSTGRSPSSGKRHARLVASRPELQAALPSAAGGTLAEESTPILADAPPVDQAAVTNAAAPASGSSMSDDDRARSPSARRVAREQTLKSGSAGIEGADTLLAAAARARARGAYAESADYYRMLQRHYPNTEAEIVARVSLGRLLCLRLGQPRVALDLFDEYLSQRPHGQLGQEARSGRALCLERLGRSDEAKAAWEELVRLHPNSVYADEARVRLARP
jgi:TolA-binding protein